mgnify:FL=1
MTATLLRAFRSLSGLRFAAISGLLAVLLLIGEPTGAQAQPLQFDNAYKAELASESAALRARIQQWPAPLQDMNQQISAALRANDPAQAQRIAEALSQREPGNADIKNFLGKLQSINGQQAAAVKLFDEAITLAPDNRWFYVNKAGAQAELRDLPNALATAQALTARYPQWSIGLNLQAALLDGLDRIPEALKVYDQAAVSYTHLTLPTSDLV